MKNKLLFGLVLTISFAFTTVVPTGDIYRNIPNKFFKRGEHIEYLVHYGMVNAGIGTVDVDNKLYSINGRPCYKVDVAGKSIGGLAMVANIDDFWRAYIDTASLAPHRSYRNLKENSYVKEESTYMNIFGKTARVKDDKDKTEKTINTPSYVLDIVGGFYYLRTLDYAKMAKGQFFMMDCILDTDIHTLKVEFLGTEDVKTKFGTIKCYVMSPIVPKNQLFKGERPVKVWISADNNRIPMKMQAEFVVGAVKVDLKDFKNMRHGFNFVK